MHRENSSKTHILFIVAFVDALKFSGYAALLWIALQTVCGIRQRSGDSKGSTVPPIDRPSVMSQRL